VLIGELESLDDSERFFDGSTDGEIVNVGSSEDTLGVDEEGASERDSLVFEVNTVGLGDGVGSIGELTSVSECKGASERLRKEEREEGGVWQDKKNRWESKMVVE
jgi:hypothetical protein